MTFDRFKEIIDATEPSKIVGISQLHLSVATRRLEESPDNPKIIQFGRFLEEWTPPSPCSKEDADFYKRTVERMVKAEIWPAYALDTFRGWIF
jgi:hypothetical protein